MLLLIPLQDSQGTFRRALINFVLRKGLTNANFERSLMTKEVNHKNNDKGKRIMLWMSREKQVMTKEEKKVATT